MKRNCDYCGTEYEYKRKTSKFCSDSHRKAWERNGCKPLSVTARHANVTLKTPELDYKAIGAAVVAAMKEGGLIAGGSSSGSAPGKIILAPRAFDDDDDAIEMKSAQVNTAANFASCIGGVQAKSKAKPARAGMKQINIGALAPPIDDDDDKIIFN